MAKNEDLTPAESVEIETVVDQPIVLDTYTAPAVEATPRPDCNGCDIKDGYCQGCGKFEPVAPTED